MYEYDAKNSIQFNFKTSRASNGINGYVIGSLVVLVPTA